MLKRFLLLAGLLSFGTTPTFAAGTIPGISMTQQLDQFAHPLIGGQLYFIQAGTTSTPQSCYQDTALTLAWPNPITLDASGRVPQVFCADGNIKIRLTDRNGVTQLVQDNLLVVGPSGGGGGGGTVDPTTILATGDLKVSYGTGVLSGFVRANGRTIGSATSGATERANADCQSLFQYLWGADGNLAVSGGRGASAAADWAANKTIALPDLRGRTIAGLDDMGNTAAGRLTSSYFGHATNLGDVGGGESTALISANLPPYTPSGSVTTTAGSANDTVLVSGNAANSLGGGVAGFGWSSAPTLKTLQSAIGSIGSSFSGSPQGGTSTPFKTVQPTILATIYLKL